MSKAWVILERRYGAGGPNPSSAELKEAISELYHENLPGMLEGDYEEHGAGSLRYGFDDGPMFVIEITRGGIVRFEEWADQDYEHQLKPTVELNGVSEEQALHFWKLLADGEIDKVRSFFTTE